MIIGRSMISTSPISPVAQLRTNNSLSGIYTSSQLTDSEHLQCRISSCMMNFLTYDTAHGRACMENRFDHESDRLINQIVHQPELWPSLAR